MDIELVNKIKRLTIIALASDDELVESLVLKGGNAIDLTAHLDEDFMSRTSYDLDYSIQNGDFVEEPSIISKRIEATLSQTFRENGYKVIDFRFLIKPKESNAETAVFWGGYKVEFKIIDYESYADNIKNIENQRRFSIPVNPNNSTKFELEFSKYEFIGQKDLVRVDGYKIYVYTPMMIAFEKLRAICQQIPEYKIHVPSFSPRARARDFYDIFLMMDMHLIEPSTIENIDLIKNIFYSKRVPVEFIKKIRNSRAFHLDNWQSVVDTISYKKHLKDFDYYFEYVLERFEALTFH